ncbi:hypothetical protein ACWGIP_34960, partial [Streptomyces sp. NPDC054838]
TGHLKAPTGKPAGAFCVPPTAYDCQCAFCGYDGRIGAVPVAPEAARGRRRASALARRSTVPGTPAAPSTAPRARPRGLSTAPAGSPSADCGTPALTVRGDRKVITRLDLAARGASEAATSPMTGVGDLGPGEDPVPALLGGSAVVRLDQRPPGRPALPPPPRPPALAARLLTVPPSAPEPGPFGPGGVPFGTDTEEIVAGYAEQPSYSDVRRPARAIDSGTAVTVDYVATAGARTVRILESLVRDPPCLEAWCHLRDVERVFALPGSGRDARVGRTRFPPRGAVGRQILSPVRLFPPCGWTAGRGRPGREEARL